MVTPPSFSPKLSTNYPDLNSFGEANCDDAPFNFADAKIAIFTSVRFRRKLADLPSVRF